MQSTVDLLPADGVSEIGWKEVNQGQDETAELVALVHEKTGAAADRGVRRPGQQCRLKAPCPGCGN